MKFQAMLMDIGIKIERPGSVFVYIAGILVKQNLLNGENMRFFDSLKKIININGKDDRPLTITAVLGKDSCSRLLSDFADDHLDDCEKLMIIKYSNYSVDVFTSDNMSDVESIGLVKVVESMLISSEED